MNIKNSVEKVIAYEQGNMDAGQIIAFFQELIDSGLAWELQGNYGRQAKSLLASGVCHPRVDPPETLDSKGVFRPKED